MATATTPSAVDANPRWLVHTVTVGFVCLCVCALLIKNVLPHGQHEYGWPWVFSAEAASPGGPQVRYGPWPIYLPAPRTTWRPLLLLDLALAYLFIASAAMIPRYWLRVYSLPLCFSLRSLLMLTTILACVLSIFKCGSIANDGWSIAEFIYGVAMQMFLSSVPVGLVLTTAHWFLLRNAVSNPRRPFWRLHRLTYVALALTSVPLLHYTFFAESKYARAPLLLATVDFPLDLAGAGNGWPLAYRFESYVSALAFLIDSIAWLVIAASTAYVVERWTQHVESRTRTWLGPAICACLAAAVACGIMQGDQLAQPPWFDYYSLYFGLTAVLITAAAPIAQHWAAFPKCCLSVWTYVSLMLWLGMPADCFRALLNTNESRICAASCFVAGAVAAILCDAGYRYVVPQGNVRIRLAQPTLGEHVFIVPMWLVGIVAASVGVLLIYR